MIETFDQAEIDNPWRSDGTRIWSYAHLNLHVPWLYVNYRIGPPEMHASAMYIFFSENQLFDLANKEDVTITSVYVVTPPRINQSKNWKMDLLKSLSTGEAKAAGTSKKIIRYELGDETEYFFPRLKEKKHFNKQRVIYSENSQHYEAAI